MLRCTDCKLNRNACQCICLGCNFLGAFKNKLCSRCLEYSYMHQQLTAPEGKYKDLRPIRQLLRQSPPKARYWGQVPTCFLDEIEVPRWLKWAYESCNYAQEAAYPRSNGRVASTLFKPDPKYKFPTFAERIQLKWISVRAKTVDVTSAAKIVPSTEENCVQPEPLNVDSWNDKSAMIVRHKTKISFLSNRKKLRFRKKIKKLKFTNVFSRRKLFSSVQIQKVKTVLMSKADLKQLDRIDTPVQFSLEVHSNDSEPSFSDLPPLYDTLEGEIITVSPSSSYTDEGVSDCEPYSYYSNSTESTILSQVSNQLEQWIENDIIVQTDPVYADDIYIDRWLNQRAGLSPWFYDEPSIDYDDFHM